MEGLGFRVFGVWGLDFWVLGVEFGVEGFQCLGFSVLGFLTSV